MWWRSRRVGSVRGQSGSVVHHRCESDRRRWHERLTNDGICIETTDRKAGARTMSAYVFSRVKRHSIKASWMCTQRRPRQLSPDARGRCSRFIGSHEDLEGAPTEGTVILE